MSVLITTFSLVYHTNAELSIQAIDSIFNQTYKNIEHIIINDAPDDTIHWPKIKQHIKNKGYNSIIIEHTLNKGITKNLNEILSLAKGKYICGCSDDFWEPDYLQIQATFFEQQKNEVAVIFSNLKIIDENNNYLSEHLFNNNFNINQLSSNAQFIQLLNQNFVLVPAALCDIDAIKKIGGYFENLYAEDYQLWIQLTLQGYRIAYNEINQVKYRTRIGAVSNTYESSGKMAVDRCRLFNQIKKQTPPNLWQEVEPVYYKFAKKVIAYKMLSRNIKTEIIKNVVNDLSFNQKYILQLITVLGLYKLPIINKKLK